MKAFKNSALIFIVLLFVGLVSFVAVPNFPRSNRESPKNTCINNLRRIDAAMQQWALENNKTNSDVPTWADLKEYLGRGGTEIPKCPLGGTYTLGPVSNRPTCSVAGHLLP